MKGTIILNHIQGAILCRRVPTCANNVQEIFNLTAVVGFSYKAYPARQLPSRGSMETHRESVILVPRFLDRTCIAGWPRLDHPYLGPSFNQNDDSSNAAN
jgi:hypothetical protein